VQEDVLESIRARNKCTLQRLQCIRAAAIAASAAAVAPHLPRTLRNLLEAYRPGALHAIHVACEADAWRSDHISAALAAAMLQDLRGACTIPLVALQGAAGAVLQEVEG
jgi:hypothetical protein